MSSKGSNKWKDALLKTSLPLEYLVAEKLSRKGFSIRGEYSYTRKNEQGIETEFSVDLHAVDLFKKRADDHWASLDILVECKYNHPGVKWVFSPHPKGAIIVTGVITTLEDLCTRRISQPDPLYAIDKDLPFCVKGIELHDNDANTQSITRGLHQLRWATPQLASDLLRQQIKSWHDEDLLIGFLCPMLVTNASLHVLKSGLNIQKYQNASELSAITEEVDALIVSGDRGPQLNEYIRNIILHLHKQEPSIRERLNALTTILGKLREKYFISANWDFDETIDTIAKRILIVNFAAFDRVVTEIKKAVKESGQNLKRIARLKYDGPIVSGRIEPL